MEAAGEHPAEETGEHPVEESEAPIDDHPAVVEEGATTTAAANQVQSDAATIVPEGAEGDSAVTAHEEPVRPQEEVRAAEEGEEVVAEEEEEDAAAEEGEEAARRKKPSQPQPKVWMPIWTITG